MPSFFFFQAYRVPFPLTWQIHIQYVICISQCLSESQECQPLCCPSIPALHIWLKDLSTYIWTIYFPHALKALFLFLSFHNLDCYVLNILCYPNIHPSMALFVFHLMLHVSFILQERFHLITKWTLLSQYETNLLPCHGMIVYIAKSGYYELSNIFLGAKWRTLQMSAKRYEPE